MISFEQAGLRDELLHAVTDLGFIEPTPVQEQAIPHILNSEEDLIALAQTGTGKTAAFGLPILNSLEKNTKNIQAIILCPTRELCLQIVKDMGAYSKYLKEVKVQAVYGGTDIKKQINGLKAKPQIVVGTPGRTLDLIRRNELKIHDVQYVVLDEADEMLNMGFREDLDDILEETPGEKQTLLFSATMPKEVRKIAKKYMNNPMEISIGNIDQTTSNVSHYYYMVKARDRYAALKRIVDYYPGIYGIIFCRTRRETKNVADSLIQEGYLTDAIHGDLSQAQRDTVMEKFRRKNLQLLVATDVAARGIDVDELTHVINYNLPDDPEVYVHRSGRTGRAGNKGESLIIVHSREGKRIRELEKLLHKKIEKREIPSGKEIVERRLYASIEKIENLEVDERQIEPYMETISKRLEGMGREELLKRFVAMEFNNFLEYYKNAGDLNTGETKEKQRNGDYTRFFIPIGKKQRIKAPNLIGLINDVTGTKDINIGEIEILRNFSFFEADSQHAQLILDSFKNEEVSVEIAGPKEDKGFDRSNDRRRKPGNERRKRSKRGGEGRKFYGKSKKSGGDFKNKKRRGRSRGR